MQSSRFAEYRKASIEDASVIKDAGSLTEGTQRILDRLYLEIVTSPVTDLGAALDKLWFAHHCLIEEDDVKEASNLIFQVCQALEHFVSVKKPDNVPPT